MDWHRVPQWSGHKNCHKDILGWKVGVKRNTGSRQGVMGHTFENRKDRERFPQWELGLAGMARGGGGGTRGSRTIGTDWVIARAAPARQGKCTVWTIPNEIHLPKGCLSPPAEYLWCSLVHPKSLEQNLVHGRSSEHCWKDKRTVTLHEIHTLPCQGDRPAKRSWQYWSGSAETETPE
jgi:hypothetical protein